MEFGFWGLATIRIPGSSFFVDGGNFPFVEVVMVTDGQVRKLWKLLAAGETLALAARKTGMDEKTARTYRESQRLPSQGTTSRDYRTRVDPFTAVWQEVQERLEQEPKLRAFALWDWLKTQHPDKFLESQRRTFERRVRDWRSQHGPRREVMFPQVHTPGDLVASDFTNMNALGVTIAGQRFEHLLFHCTLTYSNWESVSICFSESFEALSRGLQDAFWEMGGTPRRHRTDSLSAAVNNLSDDRQFRSRYTELMEHYGLQPQKINVRQAHENGDVESSHGHLKTAIEQALLLRTSRDFANREEYDEFLKQCLDARNAARRDKFAEEQLVLSDLPPRRLDHVRRVSGIKVHRSSTIQVMKNTYSVPSRLIGHRVEVVIDAEAIEVWCAGHLVQTMPRLAGSGRHAINYRHIIDSLVRKPGAFENYQYREDLFPTSHFRMAYDWLREHHTDRVAVREYLKILQLAARDSQDAVADALRRALASGEPVSSAAVRLAIERHHQAPAVTDVHVEPPNLNEFDSLLQHPEMEFQNHEYADQPEDITSGQENVAGDDHQAEVHGHTARASIDPAVSGTASADVPRTLSKFGPTRGGGEPQSHGIPGGVDRARVSIAARKPHRPFDATQRLVEIEDVGQLRLAEASPCRDATTRKPARRNVLGSPRELAPVWETRQWQIALPPCPGRTTGSAGTFDSVHHLQPVGAAVVDCQTRLAPAEDVAPSGELRRLDHRRPGLCATESRRNGSAVHAACRTLRTRQRDADQQPAVQQMGTDFQGRDDDGRGDRPLGPPQRDLGVERSQLPIGIGKEAHGEKVNDIKASYQQVVQKTFHGILIVANAEF